MEFHNWIIIALIILGVVLCVGALIWTKVIKPNDFCYTSNNIISQSNIKKQLIELINCSILIKYYRNIAIKTNKIETLAINNISYSKKSIYFISEPLYFNVIDVLKEKDQIKAIIKRRGKQLSLPGTLLTFIQGCRYLNKNELRSCNVCIIVPCLNKNFKNKIIDNLHFVNINDIGTYIKENDNNTKELKFDQMLISNFEKNIVINKKKIFFKSQKNIFSK